MSRNNNSEWIESENGFLYRQSFGGGKRSLPHWVHEGGRCSKGRTHEPGWIRFDGLIRSACKKCGVSIVRLINGWVCRPPIEEHPDLTDL